MKWFESWFDTSYYHALYQHRTEDEAAAFVDRLVLHLGLKEGMSVADIACGKGRHSARLASHGLTVWGMDLSDNSIAAAKGLGIVGAEFSVHDMRVSFPRDKFNAVFNLFTSFGYFDDRIQDAAVLQNMCDACCSDGFVVQDYLNASVVLSDLPQEAELERGGCQFKTKKHRTETHIVKDIYVRDGQKELVFQEQVRIFSREELQGLHEAAGLHVVDVYGDYNLGPYNENSSPRIIVISRKS